MASEDTFGQRRPRPLSPHLQIYRPIITMVMSIMHRVTGMLNIAGLLLVVYLLVSIAMGPETYAAVSWLYSSVLGRVVLVGFSWSLIHHALGGLRHFMWDTIHGMGTERYAFAWANLVLSVVLTVVLWVVVIAVENA